MSENGGGASRSPFVALESDSEFIRHVPCPNCGSSDANSLFSDGHTYCFSCQTHVNNPDTPSATTVKPKSSSDFATDGITQALPKRGLSEDVCKKYGYSIGSYKGKPCQIAPYYQDGQLVAQKLRFSGKNFKFVNDGTKPPLFGQQLFNNGKLLIITEGEIDALSVAQVMPRCAVVSVPTGAEGSVKALKRHLEWCEGFETIVIMFDMDEVGQRNAQEAVSLFTTGKGKIASLPCKDANEMLLSGRGSELVTCVFQAKVYRPDGVISGRDTWELFLKKRNTQSFPYPWESVNQKTHGLRLGELVTLTAGTGIGKSTVCRELAYYLVQQGQKVGYMALEESAGKTVESFLSIELNTPLHIERCEDEVLLKAAWEKVFNNDSFFLYDHWGSTDIDNLIKKMKYFVVTCGVKWLFLDHISIVVSGISEGEERRLIDNIMTKLRSFVESHNVGLIIVSHLKKIEGNKGHEDGASVRLSHLRGSGAIAQLSDMAIALERNQQDDVNDADTSAVRILKNRFSGETGITGYLQYIKETGRLIEVEGIAKQVSKIFKDESGDY